MDAERVREILDEQREGCQCYEIGASCTACVSAVAAESTAELSRLRRRLELAEKERDGMVLAIINLASNIKRIPTSNNSYTEAMRRIVSEIERAYPAFKDALSAYNAAAKLAGGETSSPSPTQGGP